jgi:hypothetical protein
MQTTMQNPVKATVKVLAVNVVSNVSRTCEVCYEDLNNSTRKLVKCDKCEYKCCKQCVRTYFKDILNEPHCMNCKMQWEPDFVVTALNKSYYNGPIGINSTFTNKQELFYSHLTPLCENPIPTHFEPQSQTLPFPVCH